MADNSMRISLSGGRTTPSVSFEVFPPKEVSGLDTVKAALFALAAEKPAFISVTCGAGGGAANGATADIALNIQSRLRLPALAHLTCGTTDRGSIKKLLGEWETRGITNVLALRGDKAGRGDYRYASELIRDIKAFSRISVGAACYPEGHIECGGRDEEPERVLEKQEAGADFFITQLFFDNSLFFRFLKSARARGVNRPILAGIMPILGRSQIERMIFLCGASLPANIIRLLHKYQHDPVSLREAGIEYAGKQAAELAREGADGVHIYTMNRPEAGIRIKAAVEAVDRNKTPGSFDGT